MRFRLVSTALALSALSAPASAAYVITYNAVPVTGQTVTTVTSSSCPGVGICSVQTDPLSFALSGSFASNTLDGTISSGTVLQGAPGAYAVTLTFQNGRILSSILSGNAFTSSSGNGNFVARETTYAATNFAVSILNTETGRTSLVAPVPEPATWVMMLLGFGATGLAMRRRRRTVSTRYQKA